MFTAPDPATTLKVRTLDVLPFTVTGVNFTGALYVWHNSGENKLYICLFTYATTHVVYSEVVTNLSTKTFLLAFQRFLSQKLLRQIVISHKASTYLSTAEELRASLQSEDLKESFSQCGVTWKFIPKQPPLYVGCGKD